jgi:hypothetical protein
LIKGIKKYGKADRRCDTGNFIVLWGIMPLLMGEDFVFWGVDLSLSDVVIHG